jgi:multidrug efflux pump
VNGNIAPGTSTGDGIALVEKLADRELPARMSYEWTELTFLEKQSRNTGAVVFLLSVVFVFLVLAALYESWAFPLAVILVVPVCVACSLGSVWLTDPLSAGQSVVEWNNWLAGYGVPRQFLLNDWAKTLGDRLDEGPIKGANAWLAANGIAKQDVNVFTQVGFVVLIGLACKNAILIVEFAKVARDKGVDLRTAVLEACKLRYRPIMMTSVAFMLGVLPLAAARGAGSEMRQAIGVAVLGGMLGVTIFGVVLTPVFFAVVDRATHGRFASHPWVIAAGNGVMYILRLKFVPSLVRAARAAVKRVRLGPVKPR